MRKLGINGKLVNVTRIAEKTKAQFAAQLKQAGVILKEESFDRLYKELHGATVLASEC